MAVGTWAPCSHSVPRDGRVLGNDRLVLLVTGYPSLFKDSPHPFSMGATALLDPQVVFGMHLNSQCDEWPQASPFSLICRTLLGLWRTLGHRDKVNVVLPINFRCTANNVISMFQIFYVIC